MAADRGRTRQRVTRVRAHPMRTRSGRRTHVRAHPMRYRTKGPPTYMVLYRRKEQHGRTPRRPHYRWRSRGPYPDRTADRVRRGLMRQGYHAIVERYGGGRTARRVPARELKRTLD